MQTDLFFTATNLEIAKILFCRKKDKLSTELDKKTIILDMDSGIYSELNEVGTTIWNMLEQSVTFEKIVEEILSKYATNEEQCKNDVLSFLKNLSENNLLAKK